LSSRFIGLPLLLHSLSYLYQVVRSTQAIFFRQESTIGTIEANHRADGVRCPWMRRRCCTCIKWNVAMRSIYEQILKKNSNNSCQ
jgi:hypothetical protein